MRIKVKKPKYFDYAQYKYFDYAQGKLVQNPIKVDKS